MPTLATALPGAAQTLPLQQLFPPPERTVPRMLQRQAERHGQRRLVSIGGMTRTYAEACEAAAGYATTLAAAGIKPGDRVAIMCGNRAELLLTILGCGWLGAIAVPINVASRGAQLEHILSNCGARLMVIEREFAPVVAPLDRGRFPLETLWLVGEGNGGTVDGFRCLPFPPPQKGLAPHPVEPGDTFAILYTSGTTGPSKGVCCPHAQYFWWAVNTGALLGVRERRRADALRLPLFHTNALEHLLSGAADRRNIGRRAALLRLGFLPALARHDATVTYLLGAMVPILLARPPSDADRAHKVRIALAPGVPAQFHAEFTRTLRHSACSTATARPRPISSSARAACRAAPGLMGRVLDGFYARVVDAQDNELPDGDAGELILRADEPFAFATGYFGMPEKTVEAWRNLWFHTGDRVVRETDGYFRFVDRMKDAIRRRGENISSFEVEQVLLSHPQVANAAVFPVRSELAEDEVMAAVVVRLGEKLAYEALLDYCEPRCPISPCRAMSNTSMRCP